MGLYISLVTADLKQDHPDWNNSKMAGDRSIIKLLELPCVTHQVDDVDSVWRPQDFNEWRALLESWPSYRDNTDRFPQMLDLLEADDQYWIYISV